MDDIPWRSVPIDHNKHCKTNVQRRLRLQDITKIYEKKCKYNWSHTYRIHNPNFNLHLNNYVAMKLCVNQFSCFYILNCLIYLYMQNTELCDY